MPITRPISFGSWPGVCAKYLKYITIFVNMEESIKGIAGVSGYTSYVIRLIL